MRAVRMGARGPVVRLAPAGWARPFLPLLTLLWMLATHGVAKAYCLTTIAKDAAPCEAPDSPVVYWSVDCVTYTFHRDAFSRIPSLTEEEVRAIAVASFKTWERAELTCQEAAFSVQQSLGTTSGEPVDVQMNEPNEFVLSVLSNAEWYELELEGKKSPDGGDVAAITFVWFDTNTGRIFDVDMALNAGLGEFKRCDTPCRDGSIDLQHTLTHEAGHVLGLDHTPVPEATMEMNAEPGVNYMRTLEPDDIQGVCALALPGFSCDGSNCSCPAPVAPNTVAVQSGCACNLGARRPTPKALWLLPAVVLVSGMLRRRRG